MNGLRECFRCHNKYEQQKSSSYLPLSYCNTICEVADIGFDLKAFINAPVKQRETTPINIELRPQRETADIAG